MPETTETTTVARGIDEVFVLVSDFARLPEWDPTFTEAHRIDDEGPIDVGTRFQATGSILGATFELQLTVETHDAPNRVVLRGEGDGLHTTEDLRLTPAPEGTSVTYHSVFDTDQPDWLEKLGQPAFTLVGRKVIDELHDWLETAEPTAGT
jgi:carbon monoxide dehydrogenase subunit G